MSETNESSNKPENIEAAVRWIENLNNVPHGCIRETLNLLTKIGITPYEVILNPEEQGLFGGNPKTVSLIWGRPKDEGVGLLVKVRYTSSKNLKVKRHYQSGDRSSPDETYIMSNIAYPVEFVRWLLIQSGILSPNT